MIPLKIQYIYFTEKNETIFYPGTYNIFRKTYKHSHYFKDKELAGNVFTYDINTNIGLLIKLTNAIDFNTNKSNYRVSNSAFEISYTEYILRFNAHLRLVYHTKTHR